MLRDAWFIAVNDLRFMLRQRETLLWTFLIPPLIFYFVGTITAGGAFGGGSGRQRLAVEVEENAGFLGEEIMARLAEQRFDVVRFVDGQRPLGTTGEAIAAQDSSEGTPPWSAHSFRLTLPGGLTESVLAGEPVRLVFENDADDLAADLMSFRLNRAVYTVLADVIAASGVATGDEAGLETLTAADIASFRSGERTLTLEVSSASRRIPTGFEQSVPGVTVMFTLLVLLTTGATSLVVERRSGILRRLASAPMRRGTVVLGKWGGKLGLAVIQVGYALLIGRYALGVDYGPELPMILATLLAYTALIASLAILAGNLATSEGQAVAIGVLTANVLAALGGCFWPIELTPAFMQQLALFLPTGWMMDAMHKLMIFEREWSSTLPHLIGMGLTAWIAGYACSKRFRFV